MAKEDQIVAALGAVKSSMRHINRRSMRLGRYIGGVLEERVNNDLPANYVWVFDPQGDKRVSSPAKNLKTEYGKGLAVIVAFNVDTLEDDVIDVDTVLAPLEQGSAAAGLNSPQKPASLSTPVSARDITVGGVFADSGGGLNVRIGAFWHENGYYTDSTALTLTPTATSGKKSLAMVGVNRLTNAAASTLTADRSTATTLIANGVPTSYAVTDIMAVVDANPHIDWRGAVELKHGDTEVNPAKIIPLNWLKPSMVGADGSTAGERGLVPAPAAADNNNFLRGDATWQPMSSSFTLAGDTGTPQTISNGNTLTVAGGVGLASVASATDTLTVDLDIPSLTADASPDGTADYVVTYDASASTHKKVLLDNLPGGGSSNYQTVQYNGSDQTQRAKLDLIPGTNITLGFVDDGVGNRTRVTITASSTIGTTTPAARVSKWALFR